MGRAYYHTAVQLSSACLRIHSAEAEKRKDAADKDGAGEQVGRAYYHTAVQLSSACLRIHSAEGENRKDAAHQDDVGE